MAIGDGITAADLLDKLSRLSTPQRVISYGIVFALVLAVYWFTLYKSQSATLVGLQQEMTQIQGQIQKGRAVQSNLRSFEEEQAQLRAKLEEAIHRLPNEKELPGLLTDISSQGKKAGLEFRSFRPSQEIPHGFYAEVPIEIELLGAYHDIGGFFDRIAQLPRIVNVTQLQMDLKDHSSFTPLLKVTGTATTFRFIEAPDAAEEGI